MFAPKVLYLLPCEESTFTTLFVKGIDFFESTEGSCAATMNCSFKTSCSCVSLGLLPHHVVPLAHQNSNNRVVVWVVNIVAQLLYYVEQLHHKFVVNARCTQNKSANESPNASTSSASPLLCGTYILKSSFVIF